MAARGVAAKRAIDVAVATLGLVVLAPVWLFVGALILVLMGRPVLFRQDRPGLNGQPFRLYKFRTMRPATAGQTDSSHDSDRLTALGRVLRSSSLDELPELWNVIRGDLSLVGPRPLLMEYLPLYSARQARRHCMRPGLTGLAQVHGRNALSWDDKLDWDVAYVDSWSWALDVRILLLTVPAVLRRSGISAPGHATAPHFTGSAKAGDARGHPAA
ncbi:MAG: sugar transferase [Mycobacteriales bacterium]